MGKGTSEARCSVIGCSGVAVRSVAAEKARSAGLRLSEGKRAYICKTHYKEIKKKLKKEKMIEKWRYTS